MRLETEMMADPVDEEVAEAGLVDDTPCGVVDLGEHDARPDGLDRCALSLERDLVDLTLPLGESAVDRHRAGDIRAVPAE